MDCYDAIVVGGGHNGLVAAGYLSRAGLKVSLLERNNKVGGLAITDEIFPGYKFNTFGHHLGFFQPKITNELELLKYGLKFYPKVKEIRPFYDGKYMFEVPYDSEATQEQIKQFSAHDGEAYNEWMLMWLRAASVFKDYLLRPPPSIAELTAKLRGTDDEYSFYRIMTTSQKDLLDEYFESDEVKATMAHVMEGPPSSPTLNMYIAFLIAASADVQKSSLHGYPVGGMGSFTEILARSVQESGVHLRTQTDVERILVNDGKVHGVLLKDGQTLPAKTIVSNLDARRTFLELVGRDHLDKNFVQKITKLHARAGYMRLHCAVDELPRWRVVPSFQGPGYIMPNLELLEKAWDEAAYGKMPKEPLLGFRAPCILDKSLAPEGKYALEGWVQYAPVRPNKGSWDDIREEIAEQIIDYADEWLINFRKSIISWKLYTPLDIERWSNVTDGHMCHMDMTTDQMFFLRPVLGWTNYKTPIEGLYLCGSATHGGGAVTGIPGHNAAHVLLDDWKTL